MAVSGVLCTGCSRMGGGALDTHGSVEEHQHAAYEEEATAGAEGYADLCHAALATSRHFAPGLCLSRKSRGVATRWWRGRWEFPRTLGV